MTFSAYIARRYFFAKSSSNAVNIISGISILGIMVGTIALIVVLSGFNGLENLVTGFYNTFDPDLKIAPVKGKYFKVDDRKMRQLFSIEGVENISQILEDRVLLTYRDQEYIATLKGVDPNYRKVTNIQSAITHGNYFTQSRAEGTEGAVLGAGVAYFLSYSRLNFTEPVNIYVPRGGASAGDFRNSFASDVLYPSGVFSVQPEFDEKYILSSLAFARDLIRRDSAATSLEVKLQPEADMQKIKKEIADVLGEGYSIKNRQEQQAVFIKVMKSESLFTFIIFTLILSIASFTIMGSLSMMMLDKKEHLRTLHALGTELKTLRSIFFKEGMLISAVGALVGLAIAVVVVLLQQYYGLINLGQGYVVESYPVQLRWRDVGLVSLTVAVICGVSSWLTSRRLTLKFLKAA